MGKELIRGDPGAEYTEAMGAAEEPLPLNLHEIGGYRIGIGARTIFNTDDFNFCSLYARHCSSGDRCPAEGLAAEGHEPRDLGLLPVSAQ